jgi:MYXO-CTERM domain-containing protein
MRQTLGLLLAVAVCGLAPLARAADDPRVYHSPGNDGTHVGAVPPWPEPYWVNPVDGLEIHLWLDADETANQGSSSGTVCVDANGDETCAFDVLLTLTTDTAELVGFQAASSQIVGHIDPETSRTLRVNGVHPLGQLGIPAAIGTLTLDAAGARQLQLQVSGRHWVGAAGQLVAIQAGEPIVMLPEPGHEVLLASGLAGLALLALWRRRRLAARA